MEILPDGSFRCRVIITSEKNSSIASITSITLIHSLFCEIYKIVFGDSFASNFIEAQHYEKLTVLNYFNLKYLYMKKTNTSIFLMNSIKSIL